MLATACSAIVARTAVGEGVQLREAVARPELDQRGRDALPTESLSLPLPMLSRLPSRCTAVNDTRLLFCLKVRSMGRGVRRATPVLSSSLPGTALHKIEEKKED